jgi:hypothetical protein
MLAAARMRSTGHRASNGTYAPPARTIPNVETTTAAERSSSTPTASSEPTPAPAKTPASACARSSNSPYVSSTPSAHTAMASAPAAWALRSNNTASDSVGVDACAPWPVASNATRSGAEVISSADISTSGWAAISVSRAISRVVRLSAVRSLNNSVEYSSAPSSARPPCSAGAGAKANVRSNLLIVMCGGSISTVSSGRSSRASPWFCSTSMVWNSGWWLPARDGFRCSTSCSNGRSWCSYASRSYARMRSSTSRTLGSPDRSVRRTRLLTKNPMS